MRTIIITSVFIITIVLAFTSLVNAQTGILSLIFPDNNSVAIQTDECLGNAQCRIPIDIANKVCTQEGQYLLNFKVGGSSDSTQEIISDAHKVNWDTEQYCRGNNFIDLPICFGNKTVNFSNPAATCCGAHPEANCGKRFSNELCANPSTTPENWEFVELNKHKADIVNINCGKAQVVSTGTDFLACGLLSNIKSNYGTFNLINISKPGFRYASHSYLCAEDTPQNNDTYQTILECNGDDRSYNTKNGRSAMLGENHVVGELFAATLGPTDTIQTSTLGNYNNSKGHIVLTFTNTWAGSEDLNRFFFFAKETPEKYLSIEKRGTTLGCFNTAGTTIIQTSFDISSFKPNEVHTLILDYDTQNSVLSCTLDNKVERRTGFVQINAIELFINTGPSGAIGAASFLKISISQDRDSPTLYCSKDAEWTKDLDTKDSLTCIAAGLRWTGTKCCSEAEDINEFYNDPDPPNYIEDQSGACYNSTFARNGFIINKTNSSVLALLGQFFGCQLNETNPGLLLIKDNFTHKQLINDTNRCTLAYNVTRTANVNLYCSFNGSWSFVQKQNKLFPRSVPSIVRDQLTPNLNATAITTECCSQNQCFSGIKCVDDQRNDTKPSTTGGFRCIGGEWIKQDIKTTPDNSAAGFCPEETQCLYNPAGNLSNNDKPETAFTTIPKQEPACIANGQSIKQYYCDRGNWTSRTKILAEYLLDFAESQSRRNYSIFCDNFGEVLNFVGYETFPNAGPVQRYLGENCKINDISIPCVNQFCVLRYNKGVAFGVSINIPINDTTQSFLTALGKSSRFCNTAFTENRFASCSSGIYYNQNLNSIIFTPTGTLSSSDILELTTQRDSFIKTRFSNLVEFSNRTQLADQQGFFSTTSLFDTIYISRVASKDLFAFLEKSRFNLIPLDYIGARYINLNVSDRAGKNSCDLINARINSDLNRDCLFTNSSMSFIAFSTSNFGNLRDIWRDFTAKLRI
ncbi:MAG: hypothetical protein AABX52_03585 [Nanoarchaeota archaeon]